MIIACRAGIKARLAPMMKMTSEPILLSSKHLDSADAALFNVELVGQKAVRLNELPVEWTSPFVVLTRSATEFASSTEQAPNPLAVGLMRALPRLKPFGKKVMVRSSGQAETLLARG